MLSFSVLVTIGLIGLVILLAGVFLDGIFDTGEPIVPSLGCFVAIFGFGGALAESVNPDGGFLQIIIPAVVAIGATALFWLAFRALKKSAEADEAYEADPQDMVGKTATVLWWTNGSGEASATYRGQPHSVQIKATASDVTFTSGEVVVIDRVVNADNVFVSSPS